ncbi:MAG: substrate-binding domain-containing protein [Caldilineaceae bacterium]|nr:substrate-binding domain-containing protein [Caldilineaceae bacterium]
MTTIRDVAKHAGVAPITVSRVMNNSGYVSDATRARVEAAAAALNYEPNLLASGLKSRRTQTIALVLTDITNPFWTAVARGVEDGASSRNYTVIFGNTDESEAKQERYLSMLLRRRVDGVLLVPASHTGEMVGRLRAREIETVVLDRRVDDIEVDIVRGNSEQGARALADHLLALGHRRIGMLSGPADISVSRERVAGYRAALEAAGIAVAPTLIRYDAFTVEGGQRMAQAMLTLDSPPTAFLAANNFIAVGVMRTLHAAGLRVPDDFSLAAFDDLPDNCLQPPFLTTAVQPAYELGMTAVERLVARLASEETLPYEEFVLPTELIVRKSVRQVCEE